MYVKSFGPIQLFSSGRSSISENHATSITRDASENAMPAQGWSQRQTWRPPKSGAIQAKTGVQIGRPVRSETKNVTATHQWMTREERRCRMISFPTTTFSRSRPTMTASSIARSRIGTELMLPPLLSSRSRLRQVGFGIGRALHFLLSEVQVVPEGADDGPNDGEKSERTDDVLPEPHAQRHVRVAREAAVPLGVVAMREDRDDAGAAHALRVVQSGRGVAVRLEVIH